MATQENLMDGYLHPGYAESLNEFGTPRELPRCRGWILQRAIPGFPYRDAMGCYPLFACQDWSSLCHDVDELEGDLVSLALVTDPFGGYDEADLRKCFRDRVLPFKEHFVVDLRRPSDGIASKHHRRYARRALRQVTVELCADPASFVDEWSKLYATLIERHHLQGIKAFSRAAFARQLSVPGVVMFRALSQGSVVGAHLWYVQGEIAYSHLVAISPLGYELTVSFALYWSAMEYFPHIVRWLDLGAGAGVQRDDADGLSRFKRGWSTGTRTAYLCGRILDQERYRVIVQAGGDTATDYFPAYRRGEFG